MRGACVATGLFFSAIFACGQAGAQPDDRSALWRGESGTRITGSAVFNTEVALGGEIARLAREPVRTARLAEDFPYGSGSHAAVLATGSPFFATGVVYIAPTGSTPEARPGDDVHWCSAQTAGPSVCFRWRASGGAEMARAVGRLVLHRAPSSFGWTATPEPKLIEQRVPMEHPYITVLTLTAISEAGVKVKTRYEQGPGHWEYERSLAWGEEMHHPIRPAANLRFDPVRNESGEIVKARAIARDRSP